MFLWVNFLRLLFFKVLWLVIPFFLNKSFYKKKRWRSTTKKDARMWWNIFCEVWLKVNILQKQYLLLQIVNHLVMISTKKNHLLCLARNSIIQASTRYFEFPQNRSILEIAGIYFANPIKSLSHPILLQTDNPQCYHCKLQTWFRQRKLINCVGGFSISCKFIRLLMF